MGQGASRAAIDRDVDERFYLIGREDHLVEQALRKRWLETGPETPSHLRRKDLDGRLRPVVWRSNHYRYLNESSFSHLGDDLDQFDRGDCTNLEYFTWAEADKAWVPQTDDSLFTDSRDTSPSPSAVGDDLPPRCSSTDLFGYEVDDLDADLEDEAPVHTSRNPSGEQHSLDQMVMLNQRVSHARQSRKPVKDRHEPAALVVADSGVRKRPGSKATPRRSVRLENLRRLAHPLVV